jgi:SpoVK/Ycf46/Vps4 family AAA+-type ATPase
MPPIADPETFCRLATSWVGHLLLREVRRAELTGMLPADPAVAPGQLAAEVAAAASAARLLEENLAATKQAGLVLPFLRLAGELELDWLESCLLAIAIGAATEPHLQRLVGALQRDDGARLAAGTALSLLVAEPHAGNLPWHLLAPEGRLRGNGLLTVSGGAASHNLMARFLAVPDSVAAYVTRGELWIDERIAPYARLHAPERGWDDVPWPAEDKRRFRRRLQLAAVRAGELVAVLLRGSAGSGRKTAALALCGELRRKLLVLDAERLPADDEGASVAFRAAIRDARLNGALILVDNADALRRDTGDGAARLRALAALLPRYGRLLFFATERLDRIDLESALDVTPLEVPEMGPAERRALWREALPPAIDPDGQHVAYLVAHFPMNAGDIAAVRSEIGALAQVGGGLVDREELVRVVLDRSRHNLRAIATEVKSEHGLDDIVLPDEVRAQCLRLVELVERYGTLRDEWGLGKRILTHRGISALFSGPPGTGKTMMAGILGKRLGFDVFRIDVAQVMSKWVGETEKNLSRLFAEAARTRAVLVFDEADALFSKRIDVRAANDRYSNAQVNYLLQKMESFEGVIILTSNLERGIDEAFLRRIQFKVRFPEPDAAEREQIWRRMLPAEIALEPDVNLATLADDFPMSGGAIRNAAVRACLIASSRGAKRLLAMADLEQAVLEELGEDPRDRGAAPPPARTTLLY